MKNKYNVVSIRYNTKSDGETKCWRVVCDDIEYLTDKIQVNGKVETTKDWMGKLGFRHHVTIKNAIVDYSVDFTLIQNAEKRLFKDILKTITYRILGTSVTFGIGFFSTHDLSVAVTLGFSDLILKPVLYFIHERLWRLHKC
jgi:uncharacterized membrane protein